MKSPHTKNTLLQAATSQPTNQSLQESIFSATQEKLKNKKSPTLLKNKTSFHRTVQTLTDNAFNVNRFGQSVCKLDTTHLRPDRRAAHNKGLNEMAGAVVKRTVCFYQTFVLNESAVPLSRHIVKPRTVLPIPVKVSHSFRSKLSHRFRSKVSHFQRIFGTQA